MKKAALVANAPSHRLSFRPVLIGRWCPPKGAEGKRLTYRRAASEQANAEATEIRLKNPNGHLKPSGELVETALDTATKGGGEVNVKVGKQIVFSSSKNRKKEEVSKEEMPRPSIRDSVMALGRRLLGLQ